LFFLVLIFSLKAGGCDGKQVPHRAFRPIRNDIAFAYPPIRNIGFAYPSIWRGLLLGCFAQLQRVIIDAEILLTT
jgi:hypothetical protein